MSEYINFAYIYDELTSDIGYEKIADFIEEIFKRYLNRKPELVADLACGTGTMCNIMFDRGYDMIGIDLSPDMLNVAKKKSEGKNILYLNQDISQFELYGTVDVFLCLLDSLNYITDIKMLDELFWRIDNYLNPGGIFIFDVNSPYKFNNILSDNIYTYDSENAYYTWENEFDSETNLCNFYLVSVTQRCIV